MTDTCFREYTELSEKIDDLRKLCISTRENTDEKLAKLDEFIDQSNNALREMEAKIAKLESKVTQLFHRVNTTNNAVVGWMEFVTELLEMNWHMLVKQDHGGGTPREQMTNWAGSIIERMSRAAIQRMATLAMGLQPAASNDGSLAESLNRKVISTLTAAAPPSIRK